MTSVEFLYLLPLGLQSGHKHQFLVNFQIAFVVKYDSDVVASSFAVRCHTNHAMYGLFTYMRGKMATFKGKCI